VRHRILEGDVLERLKDLPDESVHCCVTSPPYWGLRDYGTPGQLGLEPTPDCGLREGGWLELRADLTAEHVEYVLRELGRVYRG
jgi:DNA modification methylase